MTARFEVPRIQSALDPELEARIVRRVPMLYADGADRALDRPAHVRAASSVTWVGNRLALVQDDANFVALIDPVTGLADAVTLPAGRDDARTFDVERGNKKHKLDLEAMTRVPVAGGSLLLALGSGSRKRRESVMTLRFGGGGERPTPGEPAVVPLPELYAALRDLVDFAGSDMNIEGALYLDGDIRLFGRGNGEAKAGLHPVDATCDIDWTALAAHIAHPDRDTLPSIRRVTQYELGELDGVRYGFTDAIRAGRTQILYSAAAEASKSAEADGEVGGSALGVLLGELGASGRWAPVRNADGSPFIGKIEGVVLDAADPMRALVVVDVDDHTAPSELCDVALSGPWFVR